VGDVAPDFKLEDQNGRQFSLAAELKMNPVVVVFYRGYW
jgi:peroxiredoxin